MPRNRPVSQSQPPTTPPTEAPQRSWVARSAGRAGWLVLLGIGAMVVLVLVLVADLLESAGNWLLLVVVVVAVVAIARRDKVTDIVQRWRRK